MLTNNVSVYFAVVAVASSGNYQWLHHKEWPFQHYKYNLTFIAKVFGFKPF